MFLLYFAIGWAIPIVITWGWLINAGAFSAYLSQNFTTGTAAKGSLTEILLRPVVMAFTVYPGVFTVIGALAALAIRLTLSCSPACNEKTERGGYMQLFGFFLIGATAIAVGAALAIYAPSQLVGIRLDLVRRPAISIALFGSGALAFYYCWKYFRHTLVPAEDELLLASALSFAVAYMLALSWPMYEPMVVPSLALIVALVLERAKHRARPATISVLVMGGVLIASQAYAKLSLPFTWAEWSDAPVVSATGRSKLPILQGLKLNSATVSFVEHVTNLIVENSSPTDTVYVYPYAPLFYSLSRRPPSTFAFTHFIDVLPDGVATLSRATTS
jgi:hypothetical protein